jgi:hypothetical protein
VDVAHARCTPGEIRGLRRRTRGRGRGATAALAALICLVGSSTAVLATPAPAGALTLNAAANYSTGPTGAGPRAVALGDFNGDGKPDLAVADTGDGRVSVLLNAGHGTYGAAHEYLVGGAPAGIVTGDFKGNGKLDIAVVNGSQEVTILWGNGAGEFPTKSTFTVSAASAGLSGLVAGNFNGHEDLAAFDESGGPEVFVLLNNGSGEFATQHLLLAPGPVSALAVGDLNNDGRQDLVVAGYGAFLNSHVASYVSAFLGLGTGAFEHTGTAEYGEVSEIGEEPAAVTVASLRATAYPDVVAAGQGKYSVLLNQGNGKLGTASNVTSSAAADVSLSGLVAGRFGGDAHVDLAFSDAATSEVLVLQGNGAGTFPGTPVSFKTAARPVGLAAAELDGTGSADLVSADAEAAQVSVLLSPFEQLSQSATNIALANTRVGSTGEVRSATFTNTGNVPIAITNSYVAADTFVGPQPNALVESENTCRGRTLAPGQACSVGVAIRGIEASERVEGEITVEYGPAGDTEHVGLFGEVELGPGHAVVSVNNAPERCPIEYTECAILLFAANGGSVSEAELIKAGVTIEFDCHGSRCETTILLYGTTSIWGLLAAGNASASASHGKRVLLGEARVKLAGGQKKVIHVKLTAAAKRVLKKLKQSVTIEVVQKTRTADGKTSSTTQKLKITRAAKKHAPHAKKSRR